MSSEARIEGPLTAGTRDMPYASSVIDLGPHGYEEVEYVIAGVASRYVPAPGATLGVDGRWDVVRVDEAPYRTRLQVRRPPADRFNGTVLVEFMQEYFGSERDTNYRWNAETIVREGFAWIGASLHHEGVDGPSGVEVELMGFTFATGPTLAAWDPERYGDLVVPTSDHCYDILTQVGQAVGKDRSVDGPDPLDGLPVRNVVAVGNTIAGVRLQHYINAVHPLTRVFSAFYLQDLTDIGLPLAVGVEMPSGPEIRADVDVPVLVLNTTTAAMDATARQPDAELLRFWEPAGSSHTTGPYMARVAAATKRDLDADTPICPPDEANTLPVQYVSGAALVALHRWIDGGDPMPGFPLLERSGDAPERVPPFDEHGNVAGGLRTPWVDVPVARYDWRGDCMGGAGRTYPFEAAQLVELYGTPEEYRRRFEESARQAEASGVLLPEDADQAIDIAGKVTW